MYMETIQKALQETANILERVEKILNLFDARLKALEDRMKDLENQNNSFDISASPVKVTCKGSYLLGTACGKCERCQETGNESK